MSSSLVSALTLAAALGAGVIGGVFFAFSNFVMQALARVPAAEGIRAMQAINVTVLNRWFLGVFVGNAAICLLVAVSSVVASDAPGALLRITGGLLYVVGTLGVTRVYNIPRNVVLAKLSAETPEAHEAWPRYVAEWSAWNHVRTAAALLSAALLSAGLWTH